MCVYECGEKKTQQQQQQLANCSASEAPNTQKAIHSKLL